MFHHGRARLMLDKCLGCYYTRQDIAGWWAKSSCHCSLGSPPGGWCHATAFTEMSRRHLYQMPKPTQLLVALWVWKVSVSAVRPFQISELLTLSRRVRPVTMQSKLYSTAEPATFCLSLYPKWKFYHLTAVCMYERTFKLRRAVLML